MTENISTSINYRQTASTKPRSGGCLLLLSSPIALVIFSGVILLILFGTTSNPLDLALASSGIFSADDSRKISSIFSPEVRYWEDNIIAWADEWKLDPNIVATVMQIESCGDPQALSGSGAIGLFQVMPYHFSEDENPYQPETNAQRGLAYFQLALKTYKGSPGFAFAGYNGGITGASHPQNSWSDEMNRYVYWGENIYRDAVYDREYSAYLQEWLLSGGQHLCDQARARLGIDN